MKKLKYLFFFLIVSVIVGIGALILDIQAGMLGIGLTGTGRFCTNKLVYCQAPLVNEPTCRQKCVTPEERDKILLYEKYKKILFFILIITVSVIITNKIVKQKPKAKIKEKL